MKKLKQYILLVVKLLVAFTLIYLLFKRIEFRQVMETFKQGNSWYLIAAFLVFCIAFGGFFSYRFHVLVRSITGGFYKSFQFTAIGFFFNNFLPTNVGGDGIKLYLLKQEQGKDGWGKSLSYIFTERFIGFATIFLAWIVYSPFFIDVYAEAWGLVADLVHVDSRKFWLIGGGVLLLIAGLLVMVLLRNKSIGQKILKGLQDFKYRLKQISQHQLVYVSIHSVLFHAFRGLGFYLLLLYFGVSLAPVHMIFLLFMSTFIGFLPISVGALGTLEAAIVLSLVIFGITEDVALALALFYRLFLVVFSLIGGVLYLTYRRSGQQAPGK